MAALGPATGLGIRGAGEEEREHDAAYHRPMFTPRLPPYDLRAWRTLPFPRRLELVCQAWAEQGYGSPKGVYALYALKIALYVAGWAWFCTFSRDGRLADLGSWWASDTAFAKAVGWTLLFEGLGLGCGSGPLTGRYLPPVGGALYFLLPGTTKLPLVDLPRLGGNRRTALDVALYALTLVALVRLLVAPAVTAWEIVPVLVLIPVLGILDKTLFLVFRSEHHLSVLLCLLFPDWLPGAKVVWLAVWWWAATSKLNAHFPAVLCVMVSNSPFVPADVKRRMYRDPPHDLRPSRLAAALAHGGTALEYLFPLALVVSDGGPVTWITLAVMTTFHLFILSQVPMGVPLEWNVIMIYGGFVLFGVHADVPVGALSSPLLIAWLIGFHLALPVYGSLFPDRVSFLLAMRYYAGNWATSVWLFQPGASAKLDRLTKPAPGVRAQLAWLYDEDTIDALLSKVVAFRTMHLHGRAVRELVGRAVPNVDEVEWLDGEIVAGLALGWNFGEGHLHDLPLLRAIQAQCGFEAGELRVVMVESQPIHRPVHAFVIADAKDGVLERGEVTVASLVDQHPWGPIPERTAG